jgi:hypothetical protein
LADSDAAISTLQTSGSRQVFEYAVEWCHSNDPRKRDCGIAVLCQLRASTDPTVPQWLFRDESYPLIVEI